MNTYKIIISNKQFYKEIKLPTDVETYTLGTGINSDYRIHKDYFFEDIELNFTYVNDCWSVMCSDNLYITTGESKKILNTMLTHGDTSIIKYKASNNDVFTLSFYLDFDDRIINYDRRILTNGKDTITIGSTMECNIQLKSEYIKNDKIILIKNKTGYLLNIVATSYGVNHNGNLASNNEFIEFGDFISLADFSFYLTKDEIMLEKSDRYNIYGVEYQDSEMRSIYPKFIRNVRIKQCYNPSEIEILSPPEQPQKPKTNILMSILPSFGMIIASAVMAYIGGTAMTAISGVSAVMAVITTVLGVFQGKKEYKDNSQRRIDEYYRYINEKRVAIESARKEELAELNRIYLSKDEIETRFRTFSPDLFDRERDDEDFLHVCLGRGKVESKRIIKYKTQEKLDINDELQIIPEMISNEYKFINDAPVTCDYKNSNGIGVVGDKYFSYDILKSNVVDICARHFYTDVKLFFILHDDNKNIAYNFRLLPYVNNTIPMSRNIAYDDESRKLVYEYLYNELSRRNEAKESWKTHYIIFFYDLTGFASHPISKFVKKANELGVTFVFFANNCSEIPQGCDYLIKQKNEDVAELVDIKKNTKSKDFNFYKTTDMEMQRINIILSSVISEEISLESSLTKSIDLFKTLNIFGVDDLNLKDRWEKSQVYNSMAVPLGVSKSGIVCLDLHDKAHGPHGLVAGTTGSGKSEILQSYILSMATYFHPHEVGFLIIDFKGGGMVNQFRKLPHLLGAITNIDGKEINRSLMSIKAELQKRQLLFAKAEVNHIDKYIKKYKSGEIGEPLPHLIIIVDEFAELRAEQPEFMKELISAARIGRSLGVHLILATQKPSGQVDDQIWSNSRFKLCLKVQDQQDSNEVLKSPLAAEIKEPGRAYLQVGNNEIFELFQSAFSGAPEISEENRLKEYSIFSITESGKKNAIFVQKNKVSEEKNRTQLDAIVDYIYDYAAKNNIEKLPEICMPQLSEIIVQQNTNVMNGDCIDIGIYDDPANQHQEPAYIDFNNRNTLIIGSSQSGKTNLLEHIIKSIALATTPKASAIYIIDFASMTLKNFEKLAHVGGVVTSSEDEKLKNLFKLLYEEIQIRKEKLLAVGVSSFSSYLEAGFDDIPHIYLLIDNFTALSELYLQDNDQLISIVRDGVTLGISVIVTNPTSSGIGYRYKSSFSNNISFYCNDSTEYLNMFDHTVVKPEETPGRCIIEQDKQVLECQTYLVFDGEREIDRVNQVRQFVEDVNNKYEDECVKQIPFIPNVLTKESLEKYFGAYCNEFEIPIGLTYDEVKPFYLNLAQLGLIGVCGRNEFGHKNFVTYILNRLLIDVNRNAHIVIFDDVSRKFEEYNKVVDYYSLNVDAAIDVVNEWHAELTQRYNQMLISSEGYDKELFIMIVQNNDVAMKIQSDYDALVKFNELVKKYKNMGVCIIFANYPNKQTSVETPEIIYTIRQNQHIICIEDLNKLKCFDAPYDALREYRKPLVLGDGYYINENEVIKIKIAQSDIIEVSE